MNEEKLTRDEALIAIASIEASYQRGETVTQDLWANACERAKVLLDRRFMPIGVQEALGRGSSAGLAAGHGEFVPVSGMAQIVRLQADKAALEAKLAKVDSIIGERDRFKREKQHLEAKLREKTDLLDRLSGMDGKDAIDMLLERDAQLTAAESRCAELERERTVERETAKHVKCAKCDSPLEDPQVVTVFGRTLAEIAVILDIRPALQAARTAKAGEVERPSGLDKPWNPHNTQSTQHSYDLERAEAERLYALDLERRLAEPQRFSQSVLNAEIKRAETAEAKLFACEQKAREWADHARTVGAEAAHAGCKIARLEQERDAMKEERR